MLIARLTSCLAILLVVSQVTAKGLSSPDPPRLATNNQWSRTSDHRTLSSDSGSPASEASGQVTLSDLKAENARLKLALSKLTAGLSVASGPASAQLSDANIAAILSDLGKLSPRAASGQASAKKALYRRLSNTENSPASASGPSLSSDEDTSGEEPPPPAEVQNAARIILQHLNNMKNNQRTWTSGRNQASSRARRLSAIGESESVAASVTPVQNQVMTSSAIIDAMKAQKVAKLQAIKHSIESQLAELQEPAQPSAPPASGPPRAQSSAPSQASKILQRQLNDALAPPAQLTVEDELKSRVNALLAAQAASAPQSAQVKAVLNGPPQAAAPNARRLSNYRFLSPEAAAQHQAGLQVVSQAKALPTIPASVLKVIQESIEKKFLAGIVEAEKKLQECKASNPNGDCRAVVLSGINKASLESVKTAHALANVMVQY
ncbi:hypothetical protein HDE_11027 [Halotydeus destructor]|nr:hypothetical protein HDE_11027 [Halotydeus destructor]